jgi:predicted small lipoprotein YifL
MTSRSLFSTVLMSIIIVSAISACGRKGPLEPPPASVTSNPGEPKTVTPPVKDKRFFLDPLI